MLLERKGKENGLTLNFAKPILKGPGFFPVLLDS